MDNYFGSNLKYLREKAGLEQIDLSEMLGFKSSSGVSEWEKGMRIPSVGVVDAMARIFRVAIDDLVKKDLRGTDYKMQFLELPILGTIAAGRPILASEHIIDHFKIDPSIHADFILKVKGDSMIGAGILDGDYAFIRQQPEVENGEIAAVLIDGDSATLKRVYRENGFVKLVSENPAVPTKIYDKGEIQVLGRLVAVLDIL
jgi:repressor LexA